MAAREFTDEELDAAIDAMTDRDALREAEDLVARAAPRLQRVLAEALEQGGWFGPGHEQAVNDALASSDAEERARDVRTLLAEETRLGMFVGVAVGIGLAQQLGLTASSSGGEPKQTT